MAAASGSNDDPERDDVDPPHPADKIYADGPATSEIEAVNAELASRVGADGSARARMPRPAEPVRPAEPGPAEPRRIPPRPRPRTR